MAYNGGKIIIDGINIHDLKFPKIRSNISIILQKPMFSGKLRKNFNPFDEYLKHAIWNALDEAIFKYLTVT